MKTILAPLLGSLLGVSLLTASAQPGAPGMGAPQGPNFSGSMSKLFGEHKTFSATLEIQSKDGRAGDTTIPGKLSFDNGKSRFEMDMANMKNSKMPPQAIEMMKNMGMNSMVVIARPDKKINYIIYPGLNAYVEQPTSESESPEKVNKFKVETTEVGKDTVAGHPCVKNKVVVTDDKDKKHESLVWNATDLKNFPVKIESAEGGSNVTMMFSDVKFTAPAAQEFNAPANMKSYSDPSTLMQTEMMKRMGGGGFAPPQR